MEGGSQPGWLHRREGLGPAASGMFAGRPIAPLGHRAAAFLADAGLALGGGFVAGVALRGGGGDAADARRATTIAAVVAIWLLITAGATALFEGRSVGKRLAGLRVLDRNGSAAGPGTSLLRDGLLRLLYAIPPFFVVDSLWALGAAGQTLRDKMASTYVVQEVDGVRGAWVAALVGTAGLAAWVGVTQTVEPKQERHETYTRLDRRLFVNLCVEDGSPERRCECIYRQISTRVPYDEYEEAGNEPDPSRWPARVREVVDDAYSRCAD